MRADFRGRMQQTLVQGFGLGACLWFSGACMEDLYVSMYKSLFWQPFRGNVAGLAAPPFFASKQRLLSILLANLFASAASAFAVVAAPLHKTTACACVCECMCVPFFSGFLLSEQGRLGRPYSCSRAQLTDRSIAC